MSRDVVIQDIKRQFYLCTSHMSDRTILHLYPRVVADQFEAALVKVEQLRGLLQRPSDLCKNARWIDASVLDGGVKRMVGTVLERLMLPLRMDKFPSVFENELRILYQGDQRFQVEGGDVNAWQHDIKELNCLSALVLLYYYASWHMLLLAINARDCPCGVKDARDLFPKLRDVFKADSHLEQSPFWGRGLDTTRNVKRVYRHVLKFICAYPAAENQQEAEVWRITRLVNGMSVAKVLATPDITGGVFPVFSHAEEISLWDDMKKSIEIQVQDGSGPREVRAFRLYKILSRVPYAANEDGFKSKAHKAATFDYGCLGIMTDVIRSVVVLVETSLAVMSHEEHNLTIERVLVQACFHQRPQYTETLQGFRAREPVEGVLATTSFIRPTLTNVRVRKTQVQQANYNLQTAGCFQDVHALYWGSQIPHPHRTNHHYHAWPGFQAHEDDDNLSAVECVQHAIPADAERSVIAATLVSGMRNSLFVETLYHTAKAIQELRVCDEVAVNAPIHRFVRCSALPANNVLYHLEFSGVATLNDDERSYTVRGDGQDRNRPIADEPDQQPVRITLSEAVAQIQKEYDALLKYISSVPKTGKIMAGISWPVQYTNRDQDTNLGHFKKVRDVIHPAPPLRDTQAAMLDLLRERMALPAARA